MSYTRLALAATARAGAAQTVELSNDSVTVELVNADMRIAIQAIGRYLTKPVLVGELGEVRVEVFETPVPVPRTRLAELLGALVEAYGLTFEEDSTFYRVTRPEAAPRATDERAAAGASGQVTYRLFTVRLRHARAGDVAATLNQLYGTGADFSRPAGLTSGTLSQQLRRDREGQQAGAGPEVPQAVEPEGASLRQQVTIVPDELTNSLLIRATEADYQVLEEGIQQLDVRPLQVLIEVVVVEARRDRQFALGFGVEVPPQPLEAGGTIEGALLGGGLGDLVVHVMGLGRQQINATLTAARLRGDVDILSRPVLLASNNTEASLLVGTQQPFIQVSRSLPTDTPQRDQVVQYRDVGTKLSVLPTINQDGYVSLLVQQEISAATGETLFSAPVISSREATTQVLVKDGQTIVIGGLRDEIEDHSRSGIPLLADLPWIGALFGTTTSRKVETELFLFLTPTIIASDEDIAGATLDRVPERLLERSFMRLGPVRMPPVGRCDPADPGCGR